jgi:hypothetical protein
MVTYSAAEATPPYLDSLQVLALALGVEFTNTTTPIPRSLAKFHRVVAFRRAIETIDSSKISPDIFESLVREKLYIAEECERIISTRLAEPPECLRRFPGWHWELDPFNLFHAAMDAIITWLSKHSENNDAELAIMCADQMLGREKFYRIYTEVGQEIDRAKFHLLAAIKKGSIQCIARDCFDGQVKVLEKTQWYDTEHVEYRPDGGGEDSALLSAPPGSRNLSFERSEVETLFKSVLSSGEANAVERGSRQLEKPKPTEEDKPLVVEIRRRLANGDIPGSNVSWKLFCDEIRVACNGWAPNRKMVRGFSDKAIERAVKQIQKVTQ